jgi:pyrimidine-nucleoside phosphorylase
MRDPLAAALLFRTLRKAVEAPLTIKIRGGWDERTLTAVEIARVAEAEGVDGITVHPRTRSQQFTGRAPWDVIGAVVAAVGLPVTGNGDVRSVDDARALADAMRELGRRAGRRVVCVLTDMDQPLGHAVGNALEIEETVDTLRGNGPPDFTELVLAASAHLLTLSDLGLDGTAARGRVEEAIGSGAAHEAYERWIRAQGGDPDVSALPRAAVVRTVLAPGSGYVTRLGAIAIGTAALHLGAGRRTKEDDIDHAVGVRVLRKRGDHVDEGDVLAEIHARDEPSANLAVAEVLSAYRIGGEAPGGRPIVLETLT